MRQNGTAAEVLKHLAGIKCRKGMVGAQGWWAGGRQAGGAVSKQEDESWWAVGALLLGKGTICKELLSAFIAAGAAQPQPLTHSTDAGAAGPFTPLRHALSALPAGALVPARRGGEQRRAGARGRGLLQLRLAGAVPLSPSQCSSLPCRPSACILHRL